VTNTASGDRGGRPATVQGGYVLARAGGSRAAFDMGVRGPLSRLAPQQAASAPSEPESDRADHTP
jgi:hypothetical protein